MLDLIKKFEATAPEIVFEWSDSETEAKGWVVINSLRGGAAGGGTRMREGLDRHEVTSLAKTMEVKFTVSGPAIGGAKSGINFDPKDPRKEGVLKRWYKAIMPILKTYYGTGGDLNVDEIEEVIPITESYGLWHPQEGVVNGHYQPNESEKIQKIDRLRQGVSRAVTSLNYTPVSEVFTIADLVTGYGVAEAILKYYQLWGGAVKGKRALIQGWGNVGAPAAYYLAKAGVNIVGIIDKDWAAFNPKGYSFDTISHLLVERKNNIDIPGITHDLEEMKQFWDLEAEIFIPAAGSRIVQKSNLKSLLNNKLEVISCGANVPFNDQEIFYGDTLALADANVAVIPDFIANCGMARVFAYLMENEQNTKDEAIFNDTSNAIYNALAKVYQQSPNKTGISRAALEIALTQLVEPQVAIDKELNIKTLHHA